MKYSKHQIGEELKHELNKGYDIERIANWAADLYFSGRGNFSDELHEILQFIYIMDAGPEFVHSEQELRFLVEKLINNEENPIKQIDDLKLND